MLELETTRKASPDSSMTNVVSLNNVSLDDPSGILYPLDFGSLGRCVPCTTRPLDNASLTDLVLTCLGTHFSGTYRPGIDSYWLVMV
jgi:hypothetical protein